MSGGNQCDLCGTEMDEETGAVPVSGLGVICDACQRREFGPFEDQVDYEDDDQ